MRLSMKRQQQQETTSGQKLTHSSTIEFSQATPKKIQYLCLAPATRTTLGHYHHPLSIYITLILPLQMPSTHATCTS